jgi:hypothetical protein
LVLANNKKHEVNTQRGLSVKKCGFEEKPFWPESMGECLEGHPPTPLGGIAGLPSNSSSV